MLYSICILVDLISLCTSMLNYMYIVSLCMEEGGAPYNLGILELVTNMLPVLYRPTVHMAVEEEGAALSYRARIHKDLRSPRIESKESIQRAYV
jgi:hypothetical protein